MMTTIRTPAAGRISGTLPLLIFTGMLLLAGCGSTPEVHYYLISPQPGAAISATLPAGTVIGVGPLSLPEYLGRSQMVTRTSASGLEYYDQHRWAEPLSDNVSRVLRESLAGLLDIDQVLAYPWPRNRVVDYQVILDITRLDADGMGIVSLEGRWSLLSDNGNALITGRHFTLTAPAEGTSQDAVAVAHGEALAQLARDIAEELLKSASAP